MRIPSLVLAIAIVLSGCATTNKTASPPAPLRHPNEVNAFDGQAYDDLIVAEDVINSTKKDLETNQYPPSIVPNIKLGLNAAITAYNELDKAYQPYHTSAAAGDPKAASLEAGVTAALVNLKPALAALASAKAGK